MIFCQRTNSILLTVTLICFSSQSVASDNTRCDVTQFFSKDADVSIQNTASGNKTSYSVSDNGIYWQASEWMFDIDSNGLALKDMKDVKDPYKMAALWYNSFRYEVIEDNLFHKTTLVKETQMKTGGKIQIIDATFEDSISRYGLYSTADSQNVYLYHVFANGNTDTSPLPDADRTIFVLESLVNSCQ
jgi:hypothetical protein